MQELASELLPRTPELARGMAEHLYAAIPELAAIEDDDLRAELLGSTEANIGQVLRLLAHGASTDDVVVPHEALEFLRGNVRRGIPLAALLRSYRLGHAWLWERWSQELQERVEDSGELAAGQDQSSAFMFAYVDKVSDVLVEEFGTERERMMRSAVAAACGDGARDPRRRTDRRGGRLAAARVRAPPSPHRAADRSAGSEVRGLERAVDEAAAALGRGRPARRAVGRGALRCVVGIVRCSGDRSARALRAPGGGARGVRQAGRGDRRLPQLARRGAPGRAHRVAGPRRGPAVTSYAKVELVTLLAGDLPRARAFVAGQLGPLASTDERAERLRDTVLAFLASGGSATSVAKELYVHQNTVAYRVKRAEELLGRKVSESPVELTCALTLAAVLGPAVLVGEDSGIDLD